MVPSSLKENMVMVVVGVRGPGDATARVAGRLANKH